MTCAESYGSARPDPKEQVELQILERQIYAYEVTDIFVCPSIEVPLILSFFPHSPGRESSWNMWSMTSKCKVNHL